MRSYREFVHARREAALHEFAVGDNASAPGARIVILRTAFWRSEGSQRIIWLTSFAPLRMTTIRVAYKRRHGAVPVHGAGMLKAPVNGNPARPPGFEANLFRPRGVASIIEIAEVLAGKNIPIAVEKGQTQVLGQSLELAPVVGVVGEDGVVFDARADEVVIARIVQIGALEARRRNFVDPQRFDPGVANIARVGGTGHAAEAVRHRTAITGGQKLPLLQGEVRQLVDADEDELGTLIAIDIVLVAAVAEARGRAVLPGNDALRFVVAAIRITRYVS